MKKILFIYISLLIGFCSCTKETQPEDNTPTTEVKGKVAFPKEEEFVLIGDSIQLTYTTEPQNLADSLSFEWLSDNEGIVSVSQKGMARGVSAGQANITVKSTDGKLQASVKVTVNEVKVSSIAFEKRYVIAYLNERIQLPVTITPLNATNKTLTWATYQRDVITLEQTGHITAIKPGYAGVSVSQGSITDYCVVIPSEKTRDASACYLSVAATNPAAYHWEVYLANTGSATISVSEVKLFTGSSLTEVAGTSTANVTLVPTQANIIATIPVSESSFSGLSVNSLVRIQATIGTKDVYISISQNKETVITDR